MNVDVDVEVSVDVEQGYALAVYIAIGVVLAVGLLFGIVKKTKYPGIVRKLTGASFILMTSI